jgi:hypothetical protein
LLSRVHKRQFAVKRETPPGQTAQLIALPVSLLSAENQLQERCTALLKGDSATLFPSAAAEPRLRLKN